MKMIKNGEELAKDQGRNCIQRTEALNRAQQQDVSWENRRKARAQQCCTCLACVNPWSNHPVCVLSGVTHPQLTLASFVTQSSSARFPSGEIMAPASWVVLEGQSGTAQVQQC